MKWNVIISCIVVAGVFVVGFVNTRPSVNSEQVKKNLADYGLRIVDGSSTVVDFIDESKSEFLGEDGHYKLLMNTNNSVQYYISVPSVKVESFGKFLDEDVVTNFYRKYGEYLLENRFQGLFDESDNYYYFVTGLNDETYRHKILSEVERLDLDLKRYMDQFANEVLRDGFDFAYILKPTRVISADEMKGYYKEYINFANKLDGLEHEIRLSKVNGEDFSVKSEKPITLAEFQEMFEVWESKRLK